MTAPARRAFSKDEIIAAIILDHPSGAISRSESEQLTAREVYEVFRDRIDVDHIVPRAIGGRDHHANCQCLLRKDQHKPKTKKDITAIAKTKRIEKAQKEFRNKLLTKTGLADDVCVSQTGRSKIPSRPLPGSKASGMRKRMSGKVEKRT